MASALDQLLRPGERVIYRTPRPWPPRYQRWHGLSVLALVLGYVAINKWTAFDWGVLATPPAPTLIVILIILVVLKLVAAVLHRKWVEVAVTDQRVLHVDTTQEVHQVRSVELAEIGEITAIRTAVRMTKSNGDIVDVEHPDCAWDIALAVARAGGLPQPPAPGPKDDVVTYVTACSGLAGFFAAVWLQIHVLSASGLISFSFPLCLLLLIPLYVAQAGWLAMEPIGLIALRPFYRADEVRAWIRFYASDLGKPGEPDQSTRLSRWRLRYFSLVAHLFYGRPPAPTNDRAEQHGG